MNNDDLRELMSAAIDGDLRDEDRARLDAALDADASLRAEYTELQRTVAHLQALDEVEPPADLLAKVRGELDASQAGRGIIHWFSLPQARLVAAAAMLLIVVRFGFEMDRVDPLSDTELGSRREQEAARPEPPVQAEAAAAFDSEVSGKNEISASSMFAADVNLEEEGTPASPAPAVRAPRQKEKLRHFDVERSARDALVERKSMARAGAENGAIWQESARLNEMDERDASREGERGETQDRLAGEIGADENAGGRVRFGDDVVEDFEGREPSDSLGEIVAAQSAAQSAAEGKKVKLDKVPEPPASPKPVASDPEVAVRKRRTITALRSDEALELRKASAQAAVSDQDASAMPQVVVLEVAGPDLGAISRAAVGFRVPGADNSGDREIAAGHASVEYAVSRTIVIGEFEPSKLSRLVQALAQHGECRLSRIDGKPVTNSLALQRLKGRVTVLVLISQRQSPVMPNP